MMNLQTLVLNADYRPLSYHPLSLWSWRDALTALMLDRVALVANYDIQARSPSRSMSVPSVVALKHYKKIDGFPAFTRYNIYLRDEFTCQYCAQEFPTEVLTFDHVIPRSRGGRTSWENVRLARNILLEWLQGVSSTMSRLTASCNFLTPFEATLGRGEGAA